MRHKMNSLSSYGIKLEQAKYHFNNMNSKLPNSSTNSFEFACELCAFIQATRNITWSMQKELSKNDSFRKWYSIKQKEMNADKIFIFF